MTVISIHQPVYLPWLGFFDKLYASEKFVFLDDVQYEKNGFQNRNKIRTHDGDLWLTVPVKSKIETLLKDVRIDNSLNWMKKHAKSIMLNYSKADFFNDHWKEFEKIYEKKFDFLIELNIEIINLLMKKLKIETKTIFSSELGITEEGSDRILKICKVLEADTYISGIGGKNYLRTQDFKDNGIKVVFQNFQHPTYQQVFDPFIFNMGTIDFLFNVGSNTEKIFKKVNNFRDDE